MAEGPCQNPRCASFGTAHPNCQCYFADGGEVPPMPAPDAEPTPAAPMSFDAIKEDSPTLKFDDLKEDPPKSFDSLVDDKEKYGTSGQLDLAQVEATARGIAGPFATAAELGLSKLGVPGISAEEQAGRKNFYPEDASGYEAFGQIAGMGMGAGTAGLIAKVSTESKALQIAIQSGLFQTSDEISNALLGQGDPEHPVGMALAHIGAAGIAGAIVGKGAQMLGAAGRGISSAVAKSNTTELWDKMAKTITNYVSLGAEGLAGKVGSSHGMAGETALGLMLGDKSLRSMVNKYVGMPLSNATQKYLLPMVVKSVADGTPEIINMETAYRAESIARGAKAVENAVGKIFGPVSQQAINYTVPSEKNREKIMDWITGGGVDQDIQQEIYNQGGETPQGLAKGGEVAKSESHNSPGTSQLYPNQAMLMAQAKGRVSNYLNSIRPPDQMAKLAFDHEPDMRKQKKSYNRAIDIAAQPLSVLDQVHKGTLEPEDVKHFTQMFPEVNKVVQGKIAEKISENQLNGERPSHKIRQALSLFTGTNLTSELIPQNIQAAQAVFAMKNQQQQQIKPTKSNPGKLSKSDSSFLTGGQALERRAQKV